MRYYCFVAFSIVLLGVGTPGCKCGGAAANQEPSASVGGKGTQATVDAGNALPSALPLPEIPQVPVDEAKRRQIDSRLADLVRKTEHRRYNAANDLSAMGPGAAPGLIALLDHENPEVRGHAVAALGWMAMIEVRNANEAFSALLVPYIVKALDDDVPSVRCWSAEVLGKNGDRAAKAIPALRRAAQDENANVGKAAEEALRRIRKASPLGEHK